MDSLEFARKCTLWNPSMASASKTTLGRSAFFAFNYCYPPTTDVPTLNIRLYSLCYQTPAYRSEDWSRRNKQKLFLGSGSKLKYSASIAPTVCLSVSPSFFGLLLQWLLLVQLSGWAKEEACRIFTIPVKHESRHKMRHPFRNPIILFIPGQCKLASLLAASLPAL